MEHNVMTLALVAPQDASWSDPIVMGTFLLAGVAIFNTLYVDRQARNRLVKREERERKVVIEILSQELSQLLGEAVDVHTTIKKLNSEMSPENAARITELMHSVEPDRLTIEQPNLVSSPTEWHKHLDAGLARRLGEVRHALSNWYSLRRLASDRWAEQDLENLSFDLLCELDTLIESVNTAIEKLG